MFVKHDANRIDATGTIVSEDTRKFLQNFVDKYVAWVQRLAKV
jgi:chromate reductase